jgi:putative ABC transport system permease protein
MQSLGDTFGQVFRAIWANKLRSFLTMFGIAWGVGSMLLLISVGEGFRSGNHRQLASFGNDIIMMWSGTIPAVPNQHTGMRPYNLTLSDAEASRTQAPDVRAAVAMIDRDDIKQQSQYQTAGGDVVGTEPNYDTIRFLPIAQGRFLNLDDMTSRNHVVVLGQKSAQLLFPGRPAMGEIVTLNGTRFTVVGVADKFGHGNNDSENQKVYIPLSVMLEMFPIKGENIPADSVTSIQYQPRVSSDNLIAKKQVHQIIARRHGFDPEAPEAFNEWDTIRTEQMVGKIFTAMDVFLGGVGIVTLEGDRRDEPQHSLSVLPRGADSYRRERAVWDCRVGAVHVPATSGGGAGNSGLRSSAAGSVVGGAGNCGAQRERHCCRAVSSGQGSGA